MVASFVSSYFFCTPNMGLTLYISVAHLIGHSDRFLHVSWFYLDNIPDRINPRPSWFGIGSIRFAQKEPDPPVLWVPKSVSQAGHSGRDLFCFRPARLLLPCELRWRGVQAWSCSIINPKRITAQHEQFSGFL